MVNENKKQQVVTLTKKVKDTPIVGIVNLQGLPAQQAQKMRAMLRLKGVDIVMTRKKLIKRILEGSGKEKITNLYCWRNFFPVLIVLEAALFLCPLLTHY